MPAVPRQPAATPTVEAMMEEATATPVPVPTSTPIPEPTPVVLGDCLDGMRLQPGEGCRYTGGGSPQANVVLSVQQDGAICREGGPAKQFGLTIDNLRICASNGFERDDAFQSEIVASANADGSWTFYDSRLSASRPSATPTPTPEPTAAPTATPVRPGKFSEFNVAGAATRRRMHEGGQIVACYEGLALPRDSFCLSEGFRFTPDYSEILDTKFLVAHLPDGDAFVLQGNTTSRGGGDIRLGWITFENRVITHLDFNASQTSTPVATATATPSPTATPTRAQSDPDRAVLVALYHSTGGVNWNANTNWLSDRPIGEWHGVTTNSNGRVIRLELHYNQLTGKIPPELGGLSNLRDLFLSYNQLTGEIPPELGGLSNLAELGLRANQLTGEIPPKLGGLSNLTWLSLDANQLTGEIPPELGRLPNLTELYLHYNHLTGEIPPELGGLSNLISLTLSNNQLTGEIPPELGGLSNLAELGLSANQLTGCIPEGLRDIAENDLGQLNLPDCGSVTGTEAPRGLTATADGQTRIDLSWSAPSDDGGATITGYKIEVSTNGSSWSDLVANTNSISTSYSHTGLTAGSTSHYRVSAINSAGTGPASNTVNAATDAAPDPDRAVLVALYHSTGGANWDANTNWLSDRPIGEWHGVTTNSNGRVIRLDLNDNQLTGEIPPELGGLPNLRDLFLSYNDLTGEIPPELGRLSNLRDLFLGANQLTGEIPPELGGLSNLRGLSLHSNQLTGGIPPELGGLSNLTRLYLGGNQLTGCIPEGLRDITENDLVSLNLPDCGAAPPPDLVVDRPEASESAPEAGARFTLNAMVRNEGNGSSAFTTLRYATTAPPTRPSRLPIRN